MGKTSIDILLKSFGSFYRGNQHMHIFEKYMKLSRCNVESRFILFQL